MIKQEDLVKIAEHDDEVAFKSLFDWYHGKLYQLARYYTRSNEVAEEVVSDVFIKVWKNRHKLSQLENLESYLFIATKNQSLSFLRSNEKALMFQSINHSDLNIKINMPDSESNLINQELLAQLEESVRRLPEKSALVYHMVKDDNMSYKEVAEALNVSVKTVEKHMGIALKRIRLDITKYLECEDINLKNYNMAILIGVLLGIG